MNKLLVTSFVVLGGLSICSTAPAAITGSKHDFTASGWADGQICLPCHAPHNNQNVTGDLLWNHAPTAATYTLYDSPTFDVTVPGQPAALSKFCLSCHDGTVALDAYTNHAGTTFISATPDVGPNFGTNLGNDHPISFLYDAALVTADTATGGGVAGLKAPAAVIAAGLPLFNGMMECATCHDVHNKHATAAGDGLLNVANAGSALCISCHIK
ncbi:MAG: cytochrome C [Proteobacteria bacterium]|nr:cytochrome C [Pseudomonadota bacterium]MBU1649523.1 cytochrome C [Pseudomonadota bacterium]MBU1986631.1 cytochrome C [Pseudomonadota bacterium]